MAMALAFVLPYSPSGIPLTSIMSAHQIPGLPDPKYPFPYIRKLYFAAVCAPLKIYMYMSFQK